MKPEELLAKVFGAILGGIGGLIIYGSLTVGRAALPFLPIGASLVVLGVVLAMLPKKYLPPPLN